MNKNRDRSIYASDSPYPSGKTVMNGEHQKIFAEITKKLSYISNEYDEFPQKYTKEGLIQVLRDQTKAKLENGMLFGEEGEEISRKIDLLEKSLNL